MAPSRLPSPPPAARNRTSDSKHTIPSRTRFAPIWPLASYFGVEYPRRVEKRISPTPILLRLREAHRRTLDGEKQAVGLLSGNRAQG